MYLLIITLPLSTIKKDHLFTLLKKFTSLLQCNHSTSFLTPYVYDKDLEPLLTKLPLKNLAPSKSSLNTSQSNFQLASSFSDSPLSPVFSPVTLHRCKIAFSQAFLTAFLSAGFLDSTNLALSRVESTPSGSNLNRGSHCLKGERF